MHNIPRRIWQMRFAIMIAALSLALVLQPAQAGWISGHQLERIDNSDGSTTYSWSAGAGQTRWERQQELWFSLSLDRIFFWWLRSGPEPEPVPEPPVPEPEPTPVPPTPEPEPTPVPPTPDSEPEPPKPSPEPEPEPDPEPVPETGVMNEWEVQLLALVNEERTSRGLSPLEVHEELVEVARLKSQDMVDLDYFAHQSPTYGSPFDMMRSFGISYRRAGENLAGAFSVESAHQGLMNSPGHRANILNPEYTHVGIGIVPGESYPLLVTQMFIAI